MIGLGASSISKIVTEVTKALVSLKTIYDIIQLPMEQQSGLKLHDVKGKIEFRNVVFSYPNRKDFFIFNNLNLTILPGEAVSIVGASGSGKSTLLLLFSTLFKPSSGMVLLDDVNIDTLDSSWYRRHVFGVVSQVIIIKILNVRLSIFSSLKSYAI